MRGIERSAHVLRGEKWAYLCDFADSTRRDSRSAGESAALRV
jgi:hypothetical protein